MFGNSLRSSFSKSGEKLSRTLQLRGARSEKLSKKHVQNTKLLFSKSADRANRGAATNYDGMPPRSETGRFDVFHPSSRLSVNALAPSGAPARPSLPQSYAEAASILLPVCSSSSPVEAHRSRRWRRLELVGLIHARASISPVEAHRSRRWSSQPDPRPHPDLLQAPAESPTSIPATNPPP